MECRFADRNRAALFVALADPDAQFQLQVHLRAGAESRHALPRRQGLAVGADHVGAGRNYGRGAAVVADRHVLVVGQQRVVRAEQLADVLRMVDADVEVGVVADARRQVHAAGQLRLQQRRAEVFQALVFRAVAGQQFEQALAQGPARRGAEGEEGVQGFAAGRARGFAGRAMEQPGVAGDLEVEDVVADGDAAAWRVARWAEDAQRQVLQREVRVAVGRLDPTGGQVICSHRLIYPG
ncbi:hypothetical protein D3C81_1392280 [compost metagenome]